MAVKVTLMHIMILIILKNNITKYLLYTLIKRFEPLPECVKEIKLIY